MDRYFIDGCWFSVQFLVLQQDQPTMARDLIKEARLSLKQCMEAQKRSNYRMKEMVDFIEKELKNKI